VEGSARRRKSWHVGDAIRDRRDGPGLQSEAVFRALDDAGLAPGMTSGFRDDYRQSMASGHKAATGNSYHGGSRRGGYGHGLAADVVSVKGETRSERWISSEILWKWIDALRDISWHNGREPLPRLLRDSSPRSSRQLHCRVQRRPRAKKFSGIGGPIWCAAWWEAPAALGSPGLRLYLRCWRGLAGYDFRDRQRV
jgi:hypothetical protein